MVTTPQPAAQRVAQRAAAMAEKVDLDVIGVIENMSWFRGDDGKRYELFGAGGGAGAGRRSSTCRCSAQIPLVPALREGGDDGHPIVVAHPDDEAAVRSAPSPRNSTPSSPPSASTPRAQDQLTPDSLSCQPQ